MATKTVKSIDLMRKQALDNGEVETANLVEALAIDMATLIRTVYPKVNLDLSIAILGVVKRMSSYAQSVYAQYGIAAFETFKTHNADMLRGMACYMPSLMKLSLKEQLSLIQPLADDRHFAVREWAWMAIRPAVIAELPTALMLLQSWTQHESERVRRYAIEITRPRGVWCSHIHELRREPWLAEELLSSARHDPAKYVQMSVANWLNDASKQQPLWVVDVCEQWRINSENPEVTKKISVRALRTLRKR